MGGYLDDTFIDADANELPNLRVNESFGRGCFHAKIVKIFPFTPYKELWGGRHGLNPEYRRCIYEIVRHRTIMRTHNNAKDCLR